MSRPVFSHVLLFLLIFVFTHSHLKSQTRERTVTASNNESIKINVDLVTLDALVMQKSTGRIIGALQKDDFTLFEDGVRQKLTHFSQDSLPLSVILLIDRGGCLDPFGEKVRSATLAAISRLKPVDEVALMSFHNTAQLIEGFNRDKGKVAEALDRVPEHDEEAEHCLNRALDKAANYMLKAGNPAGRRVIIVITGLTSFFACNGPSATATRHAVFESGSVLYGLIPRTPEQRLENGTVRMAAGIAGVFKLGVFNLKSLVDETGGEILDDKPEELDHAFNKLIEHLRARYTLGYVSSNTKRDGTLRKLKLDVSSTLVQKREGKLVVASKRAYLAPKS